MQQTFTCAGIIGNLLHLKLLPVTTLVTYFDQIRTAQAINAAVVNISGRQRMLCQQVALSALRLVCTQDHMELAKRRQEMLSAISLMETSHNSLINGDAAMKLPGQPSSDIRAIYFEAPFYLEQQIREYIAHVRALSQSADLSQENPHLKAILQASTTELIKALEAVVSQYQKESDAIQFQLEVQQLELYRQGCLATAAAERQAKKLEQARHDLRHTQAQLIQAEKLSTIGQMLAGIAHEINNPVSFIYGNLRYASEYVKDLLELLHLYREACDEQPLPVQAKIQAIDLDFVIKDLPKVMHSMQVGADRIRQIVLSLRNFSRSDQVVIEAVDLHEGIDSTLLILQNRLKARYNRPAIEIVKEYGELPTVKCCAGQINQVFMNLLSNAIDAMEDLGDRVGCITIRTSVNADETGVIIQIADNGPGMTQDVKAHLFDPFFTTKPLGKGTGLGLSISHQLVVEKHGGTLGCESSKEGTEFRIELPLQPSLNLSLKEANPVVTSQAV